MKVADVVAPGASTAPAHAGPIADRLMSPVAKFFGHVVEKKGDRVFHFEGAGYVATYKSVTGEAYPAHVRLSRGRQSAPGKKEIFGFAVKLQRPNGDQDFEMVSSLLTFRAAVNRGPVTANLPAGLTTPVDATGPACGKEASI